MWSSKYGSGHIQPSHLVRMRQPGSVGVYECPNREAQRKLRNQIQSDATKASVKIKTTRLNAFDTDGDVYYLLRVEVIEADAPKTESAPEPVVPFRVVDKRRN